MLKGVFIINCAECGTNIPTDVPFAEGMEQVIVPITLDFKSGSLTFMCPSCEKTNWMQLIGNDDVKRQNKLTRIGRS